jgi:hypothetical protein
VIEICKIANLASKETEQNTVNAMSKPSRAMTYIIFVITRPTSKLSKETVFPKDTVCQQENALSYDRRADNRSCIYMESPG